MAAQTPIDDNSPRPPTSTPTRPRTPRAYQTNLVPFPHTCRPTALPPSRANANLPTEPNKSPIYNKTHSGGEPNEPKEPKPSPHFPEPLPARDPRRARELAPIPPCHNERMTMAPRTSSPATNSHSRAWFAAGKLI